MGNPTYFTGFDKLPKKINSPKSIYSSHYAQNFLESRNGVSVCLCRKSEKKYCVKKRATMVYRSVKKVFFVVALEE